MVAELDQDPVLRAKYRDYCSAKVADALLSLPPEEIYALAEAEARAANRLAPASYNDAIRVATRRIRERLNLPGYREWARAYRENPSRYDPELMGLWESEEGGKSGEGKSGEDKPGEGKSGEGKPEEEGGPQEVD